VWYWLKHRDNFTIPLLSSAKANIDCGQKCKEKIEVNPLGFYRLARI
jgi:hypothetical protein